MESAQDDTTIPNVSVDYLLQVAMYCGITLVCLAVLDFLIARRWKGRYFVLHVFVNLAISITVLPDLYNLVVDPVQTLKRIDVSAFPSGACFAIHFYHMLAPGFRLYSVDWLHHILMVVLGCPAIIAGQVGPIMNVNYFFITGVPGGIDYFMLAMMKDGLMLPLTEKKHNNTIQVWIRAPALAMIAALCWLQLHLHIEEYGGVPTHLIALRFFCIGINYWNGLFFMQRVCGNYYVTRYKLQEEYKKADDGGEASRDRRNVIRSVASSQDLKEQVLVDTINEHPVESAVPGINRSVTVKRQQNSALWDFVKRGGS